MSLTSMVMARKRNLKVLLAPLLALTLPLGLLQASPTSNAVTTQSVAGRVGKGSEKVMLDAYESLEDFTLEVGSFFPNASRIKRNIYDLKRLYEYAKREYDASFGRELFLYIIGFKWLWGIFTLYSSTYIKPSYNLLESASKRLRSEEDRLQALKSNLKDVITLLTRNLSNLYTLSPLQDSRALRRVRAKLQRMNDQLDQLLTAIDASLNLESNFDKEVDQGRSRDSYKDTSSTTTYAKGISSSASYSRESDLTSREVWERAQSLRYQEDSKRLREEIAAARATFEDLSAFEALKAEIDAYLATLKQRN